MFDPQHRNLKLIGKPWTWADVERNLSNQPPVVAEGGGSTAKRRVPEAAEGFRWVWVSNVYRNAGESGFLEVNEATKEIGRYVGCRIG